MRNFVPKQLRYRLEYAGWQMWTMTDRFRFDCTRADYIFMRLRWLHGAQALRKRASDRKVRFGTGRCPFPWREKACLFNASRNTEKRLSVYPADTHASSPSLKTDFRVQGFLSGERNSYRGTKSRNFYISTWLYRNSCAISSDEKFFFSRRNIGEKKLGECFKGKKVSRVKSAYIKRDETFYGNLRFLLENDLSLSLSLR